MGNGPLSDVPMAVGLVLRLRILAGELLAAIVRFGCHNTYDGTREKKTGLTYSRSRLSYLCAYSGKHSRIAAALVYRS